MRVGILDILALPARGPADHVYHRLLTKQFASITPQAISVWCRRMGHETFYATYHGAGDPRRLLPLDLDVVFIGCYTQASPLAYALALLYRRAGTRTVIGGPHAKAFPMDCLRYVDLVVGECDRDLVADVVAGRFDPGSLISSDRPFDDVPTVEERMPEIRASAFYRGRALPLSTIPMLASVGCPYRCDFCIDWDSPYRMLSLDRLSADMHYLGTRLPGRPIVFHDPNFAIKFDQVFAVLEELPPAARPPYMIETSLSVLHGTRAQRLRSTNCALLAPGVESWAAYSEKAGAGRRLGADKVDRVVEAFHGLRDNVPYLQANFMFGLDVDDGPEPVELTKRFMDETPYVWPAINIPVPFGGTPLFDELRAEGRVLETMPFAFYYAPYLVSTVRNYDPVTYYEKLVELFAHAASPSMLARRVRSTNHRWIKLVHRARTASTRADIRSYRAILATLRTDPAFRAFHEGSSTVVPEFYHHRFEQMLGRYAELLPRADRAPDLRRRA